MRIQYKSRMYEVEKYSVKGIAKDTVTIIHDKKPLVLKVKSLDAIVFTNKEINELYNLITKKAIKEVTKEEIE